MKKEEKKNKKKKKKKIERKKKKEKIETNEILSLFPFSRVCVCDNILWKSNWCLTPCHKKKCVCLIFFLLSGFFWKVFTNHLPEPWPEREKCCLFCFVFQFFFSKMKKQAKKNPPAKQNPFYFSMTLIWMLKKIKIKTNKK